MKNQTIAVIRKNPWIFIPCIIISCCLSIIYIYTDTPEYTAEVKLEQLQQGKAELLQLGNGTPATAEISAPEFISDALANSGILISCFITQDFNTQQSTYLFPYTIECSNFNKNLSEQKYRITETGDHTYSLTTEVAGIQRHKSGTFGEELIDNNATIILRKKPRTPLVSKPVTGSTTFSFAITAPTYYAHELSTKKSNLTVNENNRVLTIAVTHSNPEIAKTTATALAGKYMNASGNGISSSSGLDTKIEESAAKLAATEEEIAAYKRLNQITELSYDTENSLSTLKDLQQQKTQFELNLASLNNLSNHLRKNRDTNNSMVEYGAINDAGFTEQIARLNGLYQQKENNTAGASTDGEIENLKILISERILSTRKRNAIQLDEINREIAILQHQVSLIPEKASTLTALDRRYLVEKKVYDLLVEKRAQAIVSGEGVSGKARLLQQATAVPADKTMHYSMIVLLGIICGLTTGFFITAIVNLLKRKPAGAAATVTEDNGLPVWEQLSKLHGPAQIQQKLKPLCTKVLMSDNIKTISITSNGRAEGKTTITASIGKILASLDKKVLLLDMNRTSAQMEEMFGVTNSNTLSDVLTGTTDVHDAIMITSFPNLEILSGGTLPDGINTLLASRKRNDLIEALRKYYDYILIDCPALSEEMDAIPMMKMSDVTFAITSKETPSNFASTLKTIRNTYATSDICLITNDITPSKHKMAHQVNKHHNASNESPDKAQENQQIPGFMRKIALWFY